MNMFPSMPYINKTLDFSDSIKNSEYILVAKSSCIAFSIKISYLKWNGS